MNQKNQKNQKNRLIAAFAAALAGAAAIGFYDYRARQEAPDFNPARDFMQQHNLVEDLKADVRINGICRFNAESIETAQDRAALKQEEKLMTVFYFCNALGHPAYADNPYNDDVASPPPGISRGEVKARNTQIVMQDIGRVCRIHREQGSETPFDRKLCAAAGHPLP